MSKIIFSSPERNSGRAIVLSQASASGLAKVKDLHQRFLCDGQSPDRQAILSL